MIAGLKESDRIVPARIAEYVGLEFGQVLGDCRLRPFHLLLHLRALNVGEASHEDGLRDHVDEDDCDEQRHPHQQICLPPQLQRAPQPRSGFSPIFHSIGRVSNPPELRQPSLAGDCNLRDRALGNKRSGPLTPRLGNP